jgi:hypothetical protein
MIFHLLFHVFMSGELEHELCSQGQGCNLRLIITQLSPRLQFLPHGINCWELIHKHPFFIPPKLSFPQRNQQFFKMIFLKFHSLQPIPPPSPNYNTPSSKQRYEAADETCLPSACAQQTNTLQQQQPSILVPSKFG